MTGDLRKADASVVLDKLENHRRTMVCASCLDHLFLLCRPFPGHPSTVPFPHDVFLSPFLPPNPCLLTFSFPASPHPHPSLPRPTSLSPSLFHHQAFRRSASRHEPSQRDLRRSSPLSRSRDPGQGLDFARSAERQRQRSRCHRRGSPCACDSGPRASQATDGVPRHRPRTAGSRPSPPHPFLSPHLPLSSRLFRLFQLVHLFYPFQNLCPSPPVSRPRRSEGPEKRLLIDRRS